MKEVRIFVQQLKRAIWNPFFLITTGIFVLSLLMNSINIFRHQESASVVYAVESSISSINVLVLTILPTLPFSQSYATELRNHALQFYYSRIGVAEYVFIKYLTVIISGFCLVAVGYAAYMFSMSVFFPFEDKIPHIGCSFEIVFETGHQFLYLCCFIFSYSLSGALMAGLAMWMSIYIRERYVPVILPFVIYMLLLFVAQKLKVPYAFQPTRTMLSYMDLGTPVTSLLAKFIVVTLFLSIGAYYTVKQAEKECAE